MLDDGKLIEHVQQNPMLYDKFNPDFKNKIARENCWLTISSLLSSKESLSPAVVEGRWNVLRNRFCTELRNLKATPSDSRASKPTWPLFEAMAFLHGFIKTRRTKGSYDNVLSPTSSETKIPWDSFVQIATQQEEMPSAHERPEPVSDASISFDNPVARSSEASTGEKRKLAGFRNTIPKEKKQESDDEVLQGLTNTVAAIQNRLQQKPDEDSNFGLVVASGLEKIKNRKKKYQLMAKIMELMSQYNTDEDE